MLKYMGFAEDMNAINEMKKRYYKLYFKTNKEEKANNPLQLSWQSTELLTLLSLVRVQVEEYAGLVQR